MMHALTLRLAQLAAGGQTITYGQLARDLGLTGPATIARLTAALEERLKRVRELGHENMQSLQIAGVSNLSVPILGPMGRVLAVFTCPYSERLDMQGAADREAVLKLLIARSQDISQRQTIPS